MTLRPPFVSPNFNERPASVVIDTLVLHYTGMESGSEALARLCDAESKVSAHYLIEEDGRVFALVPEEKRAWHAGISHWRGKDNLNDTSIGIEIVNPGHEHGYRPFPAAQMEALATLCQGILSRHPIPARNVIGHSDIAPLRKEDPGELFDWAWLASQGIGLWPVAPVKTDVAPSVSDHQTALNHYGYGINPTGESDEITRKTIMAFQRHFRPTRIDGVWDAECAAVLSTLHQLAADCTG